MADWLHADPAAGAGFAAAAGDIEFQTDGTMVNTWEGWREMRLGIFAKQAAGPAGDRRRVGQPPAAGAARRGCCSGASRRPSTSGRASAAGPARLGIRDPAAVSGAGRRGGVDLEPGGRQLPGSRGAAGHLPRAANTCRTAPRCCTARGRRGGRRWVDAGRRALLTGGAAGVQAHLAAARAGARSAAKRAALDDVAGYFARRADYLGYAERLAVGSRSAAGWWRGRASR